MCDLDKDDPRKDTLESIEKDYERDERAFELLVLFAVIIIVSVMVMYV